MLGNAGAPVFTPARLDKRLAAVRLRNPGVTGLLASFTHFVDVDGVLGPDERRVLERLLRYGPRLSPARASMGAPRRILVVPRLGTISPWSSKATDIAR